MKNSIKIISFITILCTVYWSFTSLLPSETDKENIPLTEFSTDRALVHLKEITKKPHYVGTEEHTKVRKYLVAELEKLGLVVEVQSHVAMNKKWRGVVKAKNILAKIKGTESGKALVLLSHYDSSVHSSYGASDAGSGIVTILETVRAFITSGKQPKNDIIILLTDAEEIGLLGAVAFVNYHKWADNVGLVLNLEARGSGGPSYMLLETNGGNKKLINAFKQAKPNFPVGNSLMYSIYKMLPNDTDLTVFREDANLNGFNFAFIDDHYDYHTSQDTYENLDRNTLKQQGDYLTTMLNYFAFSDLESLDAGTDDVYFSLQKIGLITYPFSWSFALFFIALALFLVITFYGVQKRKLTTPAMFGGFIPFLSALIINVLIAVFGWKLILLIHPQYKDILQNFTYNGHWYILGFVSVSLGITFWVYKRYFIKYSAENLIVAPIFVWGILNFLIVLYLKGSSFFVLPIYFALTILFLLVKQRAKNQLLIYTLLSIPTLLVFVPLIKMFPVGLGLKMLGISSFFVVFIFGLFVPVFKAWGRTAFFSRMFLFLGLSSLIYASFTSNYTTERKQPVSLNYILDVDNQKAYFASYDKKVNSYTKPYLGENPSKGSFEKETSNSKYQTKYNLYKPVNLIELNSPTIEILKDTIVGENRLIDLTITPQRKTNRLELIAKNTIHFSSFTINGEALKSKNKVVLDTEKSKNIMTYYITEEKEVLNVSFSVPKEEQPEILLFDIAYDLFTNKKLHIAPRKDSTLFPKPFVVNDATIIKKSIQF